MTRAQWLLITPLLQALHPTIKAVIILRLALLRPKHYLPEVHVDNSNLHNRTKVITRIRDSTTGRRRDIKGTRGTSLSINMDRNLTRRLS
ncbi:hypothetical protein F5146DRAFT_1041502 [Armillaria mellea]|nr:hypothetical protein F5146DRAFT_1041502 [Armillaria mellea]